MIIRIMNVPDGLQLGDKVELSIRFIRVSGDIAMYEYIGHETKIFDPPSNPTTQGTTNAKRRD